MHKKKNNLTRDIIVTGSRCVALGVDSVVVPAGLCNHPAKRLVNQDHIDGLPISEQDWTHCIFCDKLNNCYYAGECEYKDASN